jgi:hypothetical protein
MTPQTAASGPWPGWPAEALRVGAVRDDRRGPVGAGHWREAPASREAEGDQGGKEGATSRDP